MLISYARLPMKAVARHVSILMPLRELSHTITVTPELYRTYIVASDFTSTITIQKHSTKVKKTD